MQKTLPEASGALSTRKQATSSEQERFARLLEKAEDLAAKIDALRQAADAMHVVFNQKVVPVVRRCDALERDMVLFLQQRLLQGRPLGQKLARDVRGVLCDMARQRAEEGDEEMRAIYERHSGGDLAEEQRDGVELLKAMIEDLTGRRLDVDADSPEELLRQAMQQESQRLQADAERKAMKRKARGSKAVQQKKEEEQDAQSAMRTVYRQLASALHPDRESDPEEKARKTTLMGQANAAWERKDMSALLRLQMQVAGMGPDAVQRLGQEKAKALAQLLRDDVKRLEADLFRLQAEVQMTFQLDRLEQAAAARLPKAVHAQVAKMEAQALQMQHELEAIRADDKALRAWLRDRIDEIAERDEDPFTAFF